MKKPALRKNRFQSINFQETDWTASSKNIGEYIFRRISMDQSNKKLQEVRPRHIMSQLIINSSEINSYVNDYLKMVDSCLLYTSPSPRDQRGSRMPSSA